MSVVSRLETSCLATFTPPTAIEGVGLDHTNDSDSIEGVRGNPGDLGDTVENSTREHHIGAAADLIVPSTRMRRYQAERVNQRGPKAGVERCRLAQGAAEQARQRPAWA